MRTFHYFYSFANARNSLLSPKLFRISSSNVGVTVSSPVAWMPRLSMHMWRHLRRQRIRKNVRPLRWRGNAGIRRRLGNLGAGSARRIDLRFRFRYGRNLRRRSYRIGFRILIFHVCLLHHCRYTHDRGSRCRFHRCNSADKNINLEQTRTRQMLHPESWQQDAHRRISLFCGVRMSGTSANFFRSMQ